MDKFMVFDHKTKTRMGVICVVPLICFTFCVLYYLLLIMPLTHGHQQPGAIITITRENYDALLAMLAASAIITTPVFIYCLVILARLKDLNAATKLEWIIFLSVMAPVASALFWLFIVRDAPKYVSIHTDIA